MLPRLGDEIPPPLNRLDPAYGQQAALRRIATLGRTCAPNAEWSKLHSHCPISAGRSLKFGFDGFSNDDGRQSRQCVAELSWSKYCVGKYGLEIAVRDSLPDHEVMAGKPQSKRCGSAVAVLPLPTGPRPC